MKSFKLLLRLFAVFGLLMVFAVSGWGARPSISDQSFDVSLNSSGGTIIGTVIATNSPTSFSITGGNTGSLFVISNSGQLSVASGKTLSTATSYDLTVQATNSDGSRNATVTVIVIAPIETCPGNVIPNLNGATTTATDSENGTIVSDRTYYYYFTPAVAGTLDVNSSMTGNDKNDLYVLAGCTGSTLGSSTSNSYNKSLTGINVSANQTIIIKYVSSSGSDRDYTLNFKFTVAAQTPPTISVPNLTATSGTAFNATLVTYVTLTNGDPLIAPYYTLTGTLPAGLTFNSTTGVISGTPTIQGISNLSVAVTDNDGISTAAPFSITVADAPLASGNIREFTKRPINGQIDTNIRGNLLMIGNQLLCQNSANGGTCTEPVATATNNSIDQYFANVDTTTTTSGIVNSSMMRLDLLPGDNIIWARLYWSARLNNPTTATKIAAEKIKFRTPAANTYTEIPAQVFDNYPSNDPFDYGASADVLDLVKAGGAGQYYGANIQASTGSNQFASWMLLVVVENQTSRTLNNISIYDGFQVVYDDGAGGYPTSASVTATGFLTPKAGPVTSNLFLYTGESESGIFDGATITNKGGTPTDLLDAKNSAIDLMNGSFSTNGVYRSASRISDPTLASPNWQNLIGTDIDKLTVTNIENSQTSTNIVVRSTDVGAGADKYSLNMFAFETALYEPQLCYDYSLKQDGRFLNIDRISSPLPRINQGISSSPIELLVYLRNKEADIIAQGISLKADVNASRFDYTMSHPMYVSNPNGSALIDRGVPASNVPANCTYNLASGNALNDQGCVAYFDQNTVPTGDDIRRIRKGDGSLGSQEYIYTKFILQPQQISSVVQDINESLGLSLDYYITVGGTVIPYTNYTLGTSGVPICTPSTAYLPTWGLFNVVQHGQVQNNLKTQIARKPFDVDVIYDQVISTGVNDTPSSPVNTTVQVEMIDVDSFGDINASCANPDAGVSEPIIVPITFTPNPAPAYQTLVTPQDSSYHNFALKNGAYRVWYFTETNGTLIQNWTATTDPNSKNKTVTKIHDLFNSTSHGDCNSTKPVPNCSDPTSSDCFTCMKNNYGKPLCSRDNFSVRPEAFDIRIKDYDGAGVNSDLSHDVYGTAPDKNATTTPATLPRINLAAGYDYKYDINATGTEANVSGLTAVPRYTRYFNGPRSDYNITMMWDSPLTNAVCNDVAGRSLSFFIANGMRADQQEHLDQVGDYRLNMIDTSWTAVDQAAHIHTINNGFDAGTDCLVGNNDTGTVSLYGCDISSQHINGPLQYKDQNMNFKPAQFGLPFSYSLGKTVASTITAGGQGFVYMSDLNNTNDMNMSVRSTGQIRALGADGVLTTNFVGGCFAKDLNVTAMHDANLTYTTPFVTRMINSTIANVQTYDSLEVAQASNWIGTVDDTNFTKADNGALVNTIRFNFDRNQTTPHDPQTVTYSDINVTCALSADCNQSSIRNSTPNTAVGSSAMDFNVTHTYGRVIAKDQRVMGLIAFDGLARYEVYKTDHIFGTLLTVDPDYGDWYINTLHNELTYGDASVTVVDPTAGSSLPNATSSYAAGIETYKFNAFTVRQGYKAHIDTEGWLWNGVAADVYKDPVNPVTAANDCDNHPCFNITFGRIIGNTGSAKTESENAKANKNSSSGTGWHSTSEYAPSVR